MASNRFLNRRFYSRLMVCGLISALIIFHLPARVNGQSETGSLSVNVISLPNNPISGATVTITDKDTNKSRVGKTDSKGLILFAGLEPGVYKIEVTSLGFLEQAPTTVQVAASAAPRVEVLLSNVPITAMRAEATRLGIAKANQLGTPVVTSTVPHEITSARSDELLTLPNLDNDITPLLQVVPGAIAVGSAALGKVIIDGKGKEQQTLRLDGIDTTPLADIPSGDAAIGVLDTFQKQSVSAVDQKQTSTLSKSLRAINGPGTGSVTEMITRSGGTDWNFQGYDLIRNDLLNARNFFDYEGKNAIRRSQFGGNIGGPLPIQTASIFFGYEGIRGRTESNVYEAVPTNTLCGCDAGPITPYLVGYLPQSTSIVSGASTDPNFAIARRRTRINSESNAWNLRFDYSPPANKAADPPENPKDNYIFRFTRQAAEALVPDGITGRSQQQRVVFSNALLRASLFRGVYNHTVKVGFNETRVNVDTQLGQTTSLDLAQSAITIGGSVNTVGLPGNTQSVPIAALGGLIKGIGRGFSLSPLSAVVAYDSSRSFKSAHIMSFGVETRFIRFGFDRLGGLTYSFPNVTALRVGAPGSITFLSDLSAPSPFDTGAGPRQARQQYYMGYFQIASSLGTPDPLAGARLALTYGIRYDYFSVARERDDRAVIVDPQTSEFLPRGTPFYRAKKANFEPRFGIVYALPVKSGLFSDITLRGGTGIYTGVPKTSDLLMPVESNRFSTGIKGGAFPSDSREIIRSFIDNPQARQFQPIAFARDFTTPEFAYKWDLTLERKLKPFGDLRIGYTGNLGRNLPIAGIANPIVRVETNPNPSDVAVVIRQFDVVNNDQVLKPFGEFSYRSSQGRSAYNAMTIALERNTAYDGNLPKWLQFSTFKTQYTLSRNVGNASGLVLSNPLDLNSDYGFNAVDARHSFSLSAVYPLINAFKESRMKFLSPWTISTQVVARSGLPLVILLDRPDVVYTDANGKFFTSPAEGLRAVINTPGGGATGGGRVPDLIPGVNPYLRKGIEFLNPAAFAIPAPGTFGNLKRGQLRGPGVVQVDLALTRSLFNKEKTRGVTADLKLEVANLFNHANFNNPPASLSNALQVTSADGKLQPGAAFAKDMARTFGVFSAADPGRQIQFSLTLKFDRSH